MRGLRRATLFAAAGLLLALGSGLAMAGVVELEGSVQMHILPQPGATIMGGPVHGAHGSGPFSGQEPLTMQFAACCVDVPEPGTPTFAWDFDYDGGEFDEEALGPGPHAYMYRDGPETHYVALRMRMPSGKEYVIVEEVVITNAAPTLQVGGPFTAQAGVPTTLQAAGTDPGPDDMAVGLMYAWDYDFRGTFAPDQSVLGMNEPTVTYPYPGTYTVAVQVTDKDGTRSVIKSSVVKVLGNPVAHSFAVTTGYQAPINLTLTGSIDPSKGPVAFAISSHPQHGALTGTAPHLVYAPYNGYSGTDSLTFTVGDGQTTSEPAVATILVSPPAATPVPTAPVGTPTASPTATPHP